MKRKLKRSVEEVISSLVEELKKYDPERVILFGSRAKGSFNKRSDIDPAVDLRLPFRERRKLKERLDLIAGIYAVDLVFLPSAGEEFRKTILREGKILYEKGGGSREDRQVPKGSKKVERDGSAGGGRAGQGRSHSEV